MLSAFTAGLAASPADLPSPEVREDITTKLTALIQALESHPAWVPPMPHKGLYHVWDFVNRSKYIMTELDNIQEGRPMKHPEQIPPNNEATSRTHAAILSFQDVCTRAFTVDEMIQNPRLLVMLGLSQIDFGDSVRERSRAVSEAITRASGSS
ncbi:Fc.00g077820.m01.CDS01 [Cosmosporella sp. VM-42]